MPLRPAPGRRGAAAQTFEYVREQLECGALTTIEGVVSQDAIADLAACVRRQRAALRADDFDALYPNYFNRVST